MKLHPFCFREICAIEIAKFIVLHIFILFVFIAIYNWTNLTYYYDAFLDQCLMYLGTGK